MPYKIKHKGENYSVVNALTGKIHAKGTTKSKAMGQLHLLNAVEHGFKPIHNYHSKVVPKGGKRSILEK